MNFLWLNTQLLHPLERRGLTESYNLLRELSREHSVTYLALDDGHTPADAAKRAAEYCTRAIQLPMRVPTRGPFGAHRDRVRSMASSLPYAIWNYRSVAMREKVEEIIRDDSIDVVICDSLTPAVNIPPALPVSSVLFQHEVEALAWHRRAAHASDPLRRRYFQQQWYRMYAFERNQCRRFDHVIAVSPEDLAWFTIEYGAPHASSIPSGVDTAYFRPSKAPHGEPMHLVFTGAMDLAPNDDAVSYFVAEVLPRLSELASGLTLTIVGRDPTAGVRELVRRDSRVHVTGKVEDIRPYLERAAVVIAPLRIGGGTRPELLEAMAMETPIVSTTVGVEGMAVADGEHLLIADTPETFASAIKRLLDEPGFARELGRRAAAVARSEFAWSRVAARFAETCGHVVGRAASDSALGPTYALGPQG